MMNGTTNIKFRVSSFPHLRLLHSLLKINIVIDRHDEATQFQQNSARNDDRSVIYFKRNIYFPALPQNYYCT